MHGGIEAVSGGRTDPQACVPSPWGARYRTFLASLDPLRTQRPPPPALRASCSGAAPALLLLLLLPGRCTCAPHGGRLGLLPANWPLRPRRLSGQRLCRLRRLPALRFAEQAIGAAHAHAADSVDRGALRRGSQRQRQVQQHAARGVLEQPAVLQVDVGEVGVAKQLGLGVRGG